MQEYDKPIPLVCFAQYYLCCLLVFRMTCMFFRFVYCLLIMSFDYCLWFLFILRDRYLFTKTSVAPQWLLSIFLDFTLVFMAFCVFFTTFVYSSPPLFILHYRCLSSWLCLFFTTFVYSLSLCLLFTAFVYSSRPLFILHAFVYSAYSKTMSFVYFSQFFYFVVFFTLLFILRSAQLILYDFYSFSAYMWLLFILHDLYSFSASVFLFFTTLLAFPWLLCLYLIIQSPTMMTSTPTATKKCNDDTDDNNKNDDGNNDGTDDENEDVGDNDIEVIKYMYID